MILRIVVAVAEGKLPAKLTKALAAPDVPIDRVRPSRSAWDHIARKGGDVVVVSESLAPQPLDRSTALLNELPDLPATITGMLPRAIALPSTGQDVRVDWSGKTLPQVRQEVVDYVERAYLQMILTQTAGRVGQAAKQAGIHPRGMYDKMRRFGLRKEDFRRRPGPGGPDQTPATS